MDYKPSPIFYMGNKYKLLKQLIPLFPKECDLFLDAFGGSGVITMNYNIPKWKIYNELNKNVVSLINMIKTTDLEDLNEYYKTKIEYYNLRTKSDKKNCLKNSEGFYLMRNDYNNSECKKPCDLFLLMCYSINHLLRFNSKNEFNASNGNDSYNEKNFQQLKNFKEAFKNVCVSNLNVFDIDFKTFCSKDFVYLDPPYFNTVAVYNEKKAYDGWNIESDYKLFDLCEFLNSRNIKWGMSNVFENRGVKNEHLIQWCKKNEWNLYHLNRNYNPFSKGNSNNDEVYVCNY